MRKPKYHDQYSKSAKNVQTATHVHISMHTNPVPIMFTLKQKIFIIKKVKTKNDVNGGVGRC